MGQQFSQYLDPLLCYDPGDDGFGRAKKTSRGRKDAQKSEQAPPGFEGTLFKKQKHIPYQWLKRYVVLDGGYLRYYKTPEDAVDQS